MHTLCQRIFQLCLIYFLDIVSTAYFLKFLAITESSNFSPDFSPIAISTAPWSVPNIYHYSYIIVHIYTQGRPRDQIFCLFECLFTVVLDAQFLYFDIIMIKNEFPPLVFSRHCFWRILGLFLLAWFVRSYICSTWSLLHYFIFSSSWLLFKILNAV